MSPGLLMTMEGKITRCTSLLALSVAVLLFGSTSAQQLAPNQTNGFGNNKLITFTYLQDFDCVDQPMLDLDFNGIMAQSDPDEMPWAYGTGEERSR